MISKPLLKQSCKANGIMWIIITFAVCFMLTCVMLIAGNGDLSKTKSAVEGAIIQGELQSSTEKRAINYYEISETSLKYFTNDYVLNLTDIKTNDTTYLGLQSTNVEQAELYASSKAYKNATTNLQNFVKQMSSSKGYGENSQEEQELLGIVFYVLNPMTETQGINLYDSFYEALGEDKARFNLAEALNTETGNEYISDYAFNQSSIFLAGNMVKDENIDTVLEVLKDYGVTKEQYTEFGYADYTNVKDIARSVLVNYRANLEFKLSNETDLTPEKINEIKNQVADNFTSTLLSTLPEEVSDALEDIGSMDLYGILVGSIFFKIAGLLLPIIYLIMVANNLIAGQVDTGSMAYILSTPTKRKTVVSTQALYLIGSLFLMFVCTTITSLICINIVDVNTTLNAVKLLYINLGAFCVMFAMSGICFLTSSWFNRSKHCMAIGGGLNIFFLVATILGLFGSPIIPSVIRMDTLNLFNYVSIISLFDVVSILDGTFTFLWKLAILIAVGVICYVISFKKFKNKDLPL